MKNKVVCRVVGIDKEIIKFNHQSINIVNERRLSIQVSSISIICFSLSHIKNTEKQFDHPHVCYKILHHLTITTTPLIHRSQTPSAASSLKELEPSESQIHLFSSYNQPPQVPQSQPLNLLTRREGLGRR